jgi:hypothetical protein
MTDDGDSDRCWIDAHNETSVDADQPGAPAKLNDDRRQNLVLLAVGDGLKVGHQASMAGASPDTLRRYMCCIDDLRQPALDDDACDFCERYAQAHAKGARDVLDDCRPEFRASASFGYVKEEKREVDASHEHSGAVETGDALDEETQAAIRDALADRRGDP